MKNKQYYVYALIDPRNNEYFYIGKGKGTRYKSHLKEKLKDVSNIFKYSRIKEIEAENLEVKTEILFPYLTEIDALQLEKIIVYKIGRKAFREGSLLNFTPGGVWSPGQSVFYETKPNIEFNLDLLDFVAKEKFLSILKTSNIIHLDEISNNYLIYKYNLNGGLISVDRIICFCKNTNDIELFYEINNKNLPIYYAGFIYSKNPIKDFHISEELITSNQRLFEPFFMKKIDDKLKDKDDFNLELIRIGFSRIKFRFEKEIFKVETFYLNDNTQSQKYLKKGKPYGKWIEYHENGGLKNITVFNDNGERLTVENYSENGLSKNKSECFINGRIRKTWEYSDNGHLFLFEEHSEDWRMVLRKMYYSDGKVKYFYSNFNNDIEYSYFDENGKLIEELIQNKGFVKYNSSGEVIKISNTKHMSFVDPFKILPSSQEACDSHKTRDDEQRESDKDWEIYTNFRYNKH